MRNILKGFLEPKAEAYVLPEMPTIYLLDRDKRVLLKEAMPHDVLRRVESEASGR